MIYKHLYFCIPIWTKIGWIFSPDNWIHYCQGFQYRVILHVAERKPVVYILEYIIHHFLLLCIKLFEIIIFNFNFITNILQITNITYPQIENLFEVGSIRTNIVRSGLLYLKERKKTNK